jgi:hypothetical protein
MSGAGYHCRGIRSSQKPNSTLGRRSAICLPDRRDGVMCHSVVDRVWRRRSPALVCCCCAMVLVPFGARLVKCASLERQIARC